MIGYASNTYFKDMSKPDGDTCCEDRTLKDASEMDWPDSPSEPHFRDDLDSISVLSYLSNEKKRKHSFSDEKDPDIIMLGSLAVDKIDDGTDPRDNTGGSSSTTQHQFRCKEKKTTPILEANADSGESEKEDIVMDDTKEETKEDSGTIKVCFLISVMHVHADIASLIE